MKLKLILLIIILAISGVGIAIHAGFFISPYLNPHQDGPEINYIAPYINYTHTCYTHTQGCNVKLSNQLISYTVWSNDGIINITNHATFLHLLLNYKKKEKKKNYILFVSIH